ncbi:MAG: diadenylate cyclase CdaA [Bacilli bacterium]
MNKFIEYILNTNRDLWEWVSFGIDMLFLVATIVILIVFLVRHFKLKIVLPIIFSFIILYVVSFLLELTILPIILLVAIIGIALMVIVYFVPEMKNALSFGNKTKVSKQFLSNDETKEELINTLIKTVDHLSSRRIGAIITIEKEHTLNMYIDKAVKLDAIVSYELLGTIFHPNTPLHDGAVIIRGNHIVCASAFYPSSGKNDIPQQYGSRHRAALGISEVTDAFTIVVSEETGQLATTIDGTITGNVSLESLRISLGQHIIVR